MAERWAAEEFSKHVDGVLAGQTPPGDDPLLALAAEMAIASNWKPSPALTQRLHHRLLAMPQKGVVRSRWRWSLMEATAMALLITALVLVWSPWMPSATQVLVRAAEAVASKPGQIAHIVVEQGTVDEGLEFFRLIEYWGLIGEVTPEGYVAWAEMAKYEYDLNDSRLDQPVYREYHTPLEKCDDRSISGPPASDVTGCVPVDATAGASLMYDPFQVGGGLQHLIDLIVNQGNKVEIRKDRLDDRPVYRLTFTWEHLVPDVHGSTPSIYVNTTVLYIDRETYRLVKTELQNHQREAVHTTLILEYEILNPEDLDFDPFAWPPAR